MRGRQTTRGLVGGGIPLRALLGTPAAHQLRNSSAKLATGGVGGRGWGWGRGVRLARTFSGRGGGEGVATAQCLAWQAGGRCYGGCTRG
jgi:hypothetical protein